MGLRIGEAVKIKLEDVNLEKRNIKIETEKQKTVVFDFQPIPSSIIPILNIYIQKYQKRIDCRGGWLFPQKVHNGKHVKDYVARRTFHQCRTLCGLDKSYAKANDKNNPVSDNDRKLYNLTLHSFRHWYKVKLDKANVPYGMIKSLMRHSGRNVTDQYGQYSFEEKKKVVDEVF